MYKLIKNFDCVINTETGATIPCDSGNRHYVEYQAWLNEGNTPEAADEPVVDIESDRKAKVNEATFKHIECVDKGEVIKAQECLDYRVLLWSITTDDEWPVEPWNNW